jgi:WbqC-like protein family
MTLVAVHQPNFLPWTKLLDKILAADVYVALDDVQFTKREFHNRQKIKRPDGSAWLSVPVVHNGLENIADIRINYDTPWRRKHLGSLHQTYRRAKYFDEVYAIVERVYVRRRELLVDLNLKLIHEFCDYLDSDTRIVRASELAHTGDNTQRIIDLTRAVGDANLTSTYDSDRRYIEWDRFAAAGVAVYSQQFTHPVYPQLHGGFVEHLSALDMLFMCGPETADILAANRRIVRVL